MTKNTGYQVIDLQDIELDLIPENTKIKGIFDKLKNSNRKPLYITGIKTANGPCGDTFALSYYYISSTDNYTIIFYVRESSVVLIVENDDTIHYD